jgi:putative ABC transport system substrate-binding protein
MKMRVLGTRSQNPQSEIRNPQFLGLICAMVFALCSLLLAPCSAVDAQQTGKIFRIGILEPSTALGRAALWETFRQELSKLGWTEGGNITIEYRFAEQKPERLTELAAELVRLKVDLIVTYGGPPPLAAKSATSTIPIVTVTSTDPVATGLVASLARPGGNVTGLASFTPELATLRCKNKRLTV